MKYKSTLYILILLVSCSLSSQSFSNVGSGTYFEPFIGPYLSLLTPNVSESSSTPKVLDPSSHMIINYETKNPGEDFFGKVSYRKKGELAWTEARGEPGASFPENYGRVHHIVLKNLTSDTEYEYKIYSESPETASVVYSFKTLKQDSNSSRFLVIGDMQDEEAKQRWQDIADSIVRDHMDDFDFIFSIGDLVKDDTEFAGERFYWWKVFFDKGKELFSRKPMFAVIGNHDTPGSDLVPPYSSNGENSLSFRKYFNLSPSQNQPDYFRFNIGNAAFLGINSEVPVFYSRFPDHNNANIARVQEDWMKAELEGSREFPWVFAFFHIPAINPVGGKDETRFLLPYTKFFNNRVDWAISGHVHQYQRLRPLSMASYGLEFHQSYGRSSGEGTGYLIVPPAGQWPRNSYTQDVDKQLAYYSMHKGQTTYEIGFSIIQTEGERFSLKTYGLGDVDGRNPPSYLDNSSKKLLDSLEYKKTASRRYYSKFNTCSYRGTTNAWKETPMILVKDHIWESTIKIASYDQQAEYKFFCGNGNGEWFGDNNRDGKAHTDELSNISFPKEPGTYQLRFNDLSQEYQLHRF